MLRVTFAVDALGPFRSLIRRVAAWCVEDRALRRIEEKERRIRATVRDEKTGEEAKRIGRERMRGRGGQKSEPWRRAAGRREAIRRRVSLIRQTPSEDAAGIGVSLAALPETTVTRPADGLCRRRGAPA